MLLPASMHHPPALVARAVKTTWEHIDCCRGAASSRVTSWAHLKNTWRCAAHISLEPKATPLCHAGAQARIQLETTCRSLATMPLQHHHL